MAKAMDLDRMSVVDLKQLEVEIKRLIVQKREEVRSSLKDQIESLARDGGFDIRELFTSKGRGGTVAVKYRNPQNPAETWTGRGRMPRWLVAATKGGKVKKEDFLIV